jgi:hypothetical protein
VFTLTPFAADGSISGIKSTYVWAFDFLNIIIAIVILMKRGMFKLWMMRLTLLLFCASFFEFTCMFLYKYKFGQWHHVASNNSEYKIFDRHPYLVGVPRPGVSVEQNGVRISHNSLGFRGKEFELNNRPGVTRIITIGGSTTYCTGVDDRYTWPEVLDRSLGNAFEVINYGIPGLSTSEHIIQTALNLSDMAPDIVIYYTGWNDLRSANIANLKSDYSNYHGKDLYRWLNLPDHWIGSNLASMKLGIWLLEEVNLFSRTPDKITNVSGNLDTGLQKRAPELYRRNLNLMAALCEEQEYEVVFVPQIIRTEGLTGENGDSWSPYVKDKEFGSYIDKYNLIMRSVCSMRNITFAENALNQNWKDIDFIDRGHLSRSGNDKLAQVLVDYLKE